VLRNRFATVLVTAVAPLVWGTTYFVTTELLPPGRPLLAAVLRCLPAGLALVGLTRRLPQGGWWWRAMVLGALNIGAFFALLFIAAYRLPGGVAATVLAVQPLLVAGLAARLLGERLTLRSTIAAAAGVAGVSLLVLRADARLDGLGVAAAVGGAIVMATGVVLSKRWPSPAPVLATTGWQLVAGGVLLLPVALLVEGPPPTTVGTANLAGYAYLAVGSAVTYSLWFRGIRALSPTDVTFLGLLSPLVATTLGWLALGQQLTAAQILGGLIVLAALVAAQTRNVHSTQPRRRVAAHAASPAACMPSDDSLMAPQMGPTGCQVRYRQLIPAPVATDGQRSDAEARATSDDDPPLGCWVGDDRYRTILPADRQA
jgi:probable blue pigment (indigoidine) exporter